MKHLVAFLALASFFWSGCSSDDSAADPSGQKMASSAGSGMASSGSGKAAGNTGPVDRDPPLSDRDASDRNEARDSQGSDRGAKGSDAMRDNDRESNKDAVNNDRRERSPATDERPGQGVARDDRSADGNRDREANSDESDIESSLVAAFPDSEGSVGLQKGDLVPEIVGKDLEGADFALSDYQGKVIMIDFWGDW